MRWLQIKWPPKGASPVHIWYCAKWQHTQDKRLLNTISLGSTFTISVTFLPKRGIQKRLRKPEFDFFWIFGEFRKNRKYKQTTVAFPVLPVQWAVTLFIVCKELFKYAKHIMARDTTEVPKYCAFLLHYLA